MSEKENKSSQDTALVVQSNQNQLQTSELNHLERLSEHFANSGLYGIGKQAASQCLIKMLAGKAWGIDPFNAVAQIHIIQGKPTLSAHLMAAIIKKSKKYNYKVVTHNKEVCLIHFFENNEFVGESEFSIKDAEQAKLTGDKKLYGLYPKNMLWSRAMSNGAKWYCAELFGGSVYDTEEIGQDNNNQNSDYIDTEVEEIKEDKESGAKKESFITSINKMNQVLAELGESFIEENLSQLNLSQLKLSVDQKSSRMKELLINQLMKGLPEDQGLINTLNKESVMNLYKMYRELPKTKSSDNQVIDAQVETE